MLNSGEYSKFEAIQEKHGKMLYDQDQIIIESLRNKRLKEIAKEKEE